VRAPLDFPIVVRRFRLLGPAGTREIDAALDTGAGYTVIAWDAAKDIGYDPASSDTRVPLVTANGVIEAPLIVIDRIELQDLEVEAVEVVCHDIPEITGIEGLIGLSFLKHFRTLIDYPAGILEITAPDRD